MDNKDTNQISEQQLKKMQDELKDIQTKYAGLSSDVKSLKTGQASVQESINTINSHYDKINTNIEEVMNKLNIMSEDQKKSTIGKMMRDRDGFLTRMIKKPMRKLAVGTVSTFMTMTDYAMEKASGAKEGMEDIVAEASYNNKKKRSRMTEEMEPSEA